MTAFWVAAYSTLALMAPWLLLGALVSGLIHAWVPPGWATRRLRGRRGIIQAILVGLPLPLCSCGVIPTAVGLREDGASRASVAAFAATTPQTGVDSFLVTGGLLGFPFALFRVAVALVTGVIVGWGVHAVSFRDELPPSSTAQSNEPPGLRAGAFHALEVVRSVWLWLVVGVLLSAALTTFMPATRLSVFAESPWLAPLGALVVAIPLYVCATASVPIALGLVAAGLPASAALVFLLAGPATNVATLGALRKALGGRATLIYVTGITLCALGFGIFADGYLPLDVVSAASHDHGVSLLGHVAAGALCSLFVYFAASATIKRMSKTVQGNVTVGVSGMTCGGCVRALERRLSSIEGVEAVAVTLDPPTASASGIDVKALEQAVVDAGFDVVSA